MIKIGAIDSLTEDKIIESFSVPEITKFLARPEIAARLSNNDKMILSKAEAMEMDSLTKNHVKETHIGGSAFNALATVALAMKEAQINFVTPPGSNKKTLIATCENITNFDFFPPDPTNAADIISRISYICLDERGNKHVLKYLGNVAEFFDKNPSYLNSFKSALTDIISNCDLFFLPGGITKKFPYEIFAHILDEIKKNKKKLAFSLPTHSDFSNEEIELYNRALNQSTLILGNADEMKNTVGLISSLTKLSATSFITDGARDAYIIVSGIISRVRPLDLPTKVASFTGAGDAAYAGFIIGLLSKHGPVIAGEIAMKFANEVLKISTARLSDPKRLLSN